MTCYRLDDQVPRLDEGVFVAPGAQVVGQVQLGAGSSVWFGAVLRGDNAPITLGQRCNVQEGAVLHTDPGFPLEIGDEVTVGHQAMLHGCRIGAGSLVGIQAVVLNGAAIGEDCLVGAGALVTEGKVFAPRSLILGTPAKAVRNLSDTEVEHLRRSARTYADKGQHFATALQAIPDPTGQKDSTCLPR
jgi:carbonic anhydrase/acetyltransferase-like protein (isoleucine patch superfamily)